MLQGSTVWVSSGFSRTKSPWLMSFVHALPVNVTLFLPANGWETDDAPEITVNVPLKLSAL